VEGAGVQAWTIDDAAQQLQVDRFEHQRNQLDLRILLDRSSLSDEETQLSAELPMLQAEGVFRAEGSLAVLADETVRVQEIATPAILTVSVSEIDPNISTRADFVTGFSFPAITNFPSVTLRRAESVVHGGLDTHIAIRRDGIHINRDLMVQPREGAVFETKVTIPENESVVDVTSITDQIIDWNEDDSTISLTWRRPADADAGAGLTPGVTAQAKITTRIDPDDWYNLGTDQPVEFNFTSAETDIDVLSGYLAVDADQAYAVETVAAEGLEARDGRSTPITGKLAWARLSNYDLQLNVARRESQVFGQMTAYALPLTNTLEIEGQLFLTINYAPIRSLDIALPADVADLLKVDSPLVSEQRLDEETGVLSLRFHQELENTQQLRWRMSVPFEAIEDDSGEKRFSINVPPISLPSAKRLTGHWMLEANTDTELSFEASGLDAVDSLRIPGITGYKPQHRVIAAYGYRGSE
ncbi:MAG: hypothetical protein AAF585_23420, partial [Verrucomicrobiota bacterium]